MSFEITTAFVQQYTDNIMMLSQQMDNRLAGAVMIKDNIVGKSAFVDQVGSTEMQQITTRHGDSPLMNTPHARRRLDLSDWDWGDLVDKLDEIKVLNKPTSAYVQAGAAACRRRKDKIIIDSAFAAAATGETGSTSTSFPASQQVVVNSWKYGAGTGNAGLTISKLIEAKQILDANEVPEEEPRFIACGSKQMSDLLATTEVTSRDYNTVEALVKGKVNEFMGFTFIRTEQLNVDGSSYRRVIAWAKNGLCLGIGQDMLAQIAVRSDKRFATYVYFMQSLGATRVEEKRVVEIKCAEA